MRNALWKKVNGQSIWGGGGEGGGREVNICNTLLCFRLARLIVRCKLKPELLNK